MATSVFSDGEIETAIEQHDDPDHPESYSVAEVREVLNRINADILDYWDEHQDAMDAGSYEIVHEDSDVIVLVEQGHFWNEQFNTMEIGDENGTLQSIIVDLQFTAARNRCEYSWSVSRPVIIEKNDDFRAGEQTVLREIARRADEFGSIARAVDSLATENHGWSNSSWANLTGRNPSTVTRTTDD